MLTCLIQLPLPRSEECVAEDEVFGIVAHRCRPTADEVDLSSAAAETTTHVPITSSDRFASAQERHGNDVGAGDNMIGGATNVSVCDVCRTVARQDKCAAKACQRTCERAKACASEAAFKSCAVDDNQEQESARFGNTNDTSLPLGVATDFLLARMLRPAGPQQRRDKALEKRTRIAPIDVSHL